MAVELKGNILRIYHEPTARPRSLRSYEIEVFDYIHRLKARNTVLQAVFLDAAAYCLYTSDQKAAFFEIWKKCKYAQAVPVLTYRDKFTTVFSFTPYSKDLNELFNYFSDVRYHTKLNYQKARKLLFLPQVIETLCHLYFIPKLVFDVVLRGEYKLLWHDNTVVILFAETPLIDNESAAYYLTPLQLKIFFLVSHFRERLFDILTPEMLNPLIRSLIRWSSRFNEILKVLL